MNTAVTMKQCFILKLGKISNMINLAYNNSYIDTHIIFDILLL